MPKFNATRPVVLTKNLDGSMEDLWLHAFLALERQPAILTKDDQLLLEYASLVATGKGSLTYAQSKAFLEEYVEFRDDEEGAQA